MTATQTAGLASMSDEDLQCLGHEVDATQRYIHSTANKLLRDQIAQEQIMNAKPEVKSTLLADAGCWMTLQSGPSASLKRPLSGVCHHCRDLPLYPLHHFHLSNAVTNQEICTLTCRRCGALSSVTAIATDANT